MANTSTLSTNGAKKIKILRIITRMNIGGPAVQIIGLMNNIDKERFDQRLVIGECLGNELDILNQGDYGFNPIRIKHLGRKISPLSDLKALILIIIEIRKFKPDIIHTHTTKAGVLGRVASILSFHKSKRVHTYHGHLLFGYFKGFKLNLLITLERMLAIFSHQLVTVGIKVKNDLLKARIGNEKLYSVVNPGLELNNLPSKSVALKTLNLSADQLYCSFIGRLTQIKRPDRMLEVVEELQRRGSKLHFIVAGGGELLQQSQKVSLAKNLPITFLDWYKDIEVVLAASDITLLTSDNEGTPISLIQSQMAGVVVVSTDVGSVSEIIKEGETGFLTTFLVSDIADKLELLQSNKNLRIQMGTIAKAFATDLFSIKNMVKKYQDIYFTIINGR
jgi:glycosyltransferase involved in cell wall biosynthesis